MYIQYLVEATKNSLKLTGNTIAKQKQVIKIIIKKPKTTLTTLSNDNDGSQKEFKSSV